MGCCSSEPVKIRCDHMGQDRWNTYSKTRDIRTQDVDNCLDFCFNQTLVHECESCNQLEPIQHICQLVQTNLNTTNYLLRQLADSDSLRTQRQKLENTSDIYIRLNNEYHEALEEVDASNQISILSKDLELLNNIQNNQRQVLSSRQIYVNQMVLDLNQLINQLQEIYFFSKQQ